MHKHDILISCIHMNFMYSDFIHYVIIIVYYTLSEQGTIYSKEQFQLDKN
jgi:hypothetical protein